jgi:hypothetical protein
VGIRFGADPHAVLTEPAGAWTPEQWILYGAGHA